MKKEERIEKRWNILFTNNLETFCLIIYLRFLSEPWFLELHLGWTHANQLVSWRGKKRVGEVEAKGPIAHVLPNCDKTIWMHPKSLFILAANLEQCLLSTWFLRGRGDSPDPLHFVSRIQVVRVWAKLFQKSFRALTRLLSKYLLTT